MKTEFFASAKDRNKQASELAKERKKGTLVQVPHRAEAQDWAAFKTAIGETHAD